MKGKSCLTNLISFDDQVTHLVDEGKTVVVVYLDFSKAFDMVSHCIFLEKLVAHVLDRYTLMVHLVKSWLDGQAKSGGEQSEIWLATNHEWCFPGAGVGALSV